MLRDWWRNFWKAAVAIVAFLGSIASIAAMFGSFDHAVLYSFLIFGICLFVLAGYLTKPKAKIQISKYINQIIEISEIQKFSGYDQIIGLIGVKDVGKTTFLEKISNRMLSERSTASPYSIPVLFTVDGRQRCRLFIDSVGESEASQFEIARLSSSIVFFIDHNSDNLNHADLDRYKAHRDFADAFISNCRQSEKKFENFLITFNKFDLWSHAADGPNLIVKFYEPLLSGLRDSGVARNFMLIVNHSNNDHNKVIRLLTLAFERPHKVRNEDE